ncbi:transposase [Bradyrhizobium cytisi]|uniref:Transposase n=1 Tax=Bradyrhizobium cytisi TaxID=515489 RepID=A0A5S4VYG1_9BRAD|nr:transposase [Bradyrhizobium cytisi]
MPTKMLVQGGLSDHLGERRHRWPTAEKIRLFEETMQAGTSILAVAKRAGVGAATARSSGCCLPLMPAIGR